MVAPDYGGAWLIATCHSARSEAKSQNLKEVAAAYLQPFDLEFPESVEVPIFRQQRGDSTVPAKGGDLCVEDEVARDIKISNRVGEDFREIRTWQ